MSQADYLIQNANGAAVRADLNDQFEAVATLNSGSTAPSVTFAHMWWMDEANNILKIRNAANTAWINVAEKTATGWFPYFDTTKLEVISQAEAEAGVATTPRIWTAQRAGQALAALSPVGLTNTATLTNKRITPRVGTVASSATPAINTDNVDVFTITALAVAITSMTTNLSGTPTAEQKLTIRFKDDGTSRTIAWGASFASRGATLPTATVAGKILRVGLIWNEVASTWDCVAAPVEV